MKKLIAILLSVLMLCSVMPFAAVSAAVEYEEHGEAILIEADAEEVDAGDEVMITVSLVGNPGVIGAQVEVGFDHDAFELVTYYDEDEEMWIPPIEVGSKYNATSNKYIMFSPIDEETGYMERCLVQYLRATLKTPVTEEEFFVATFKVKDDAPSGTYSFYVKDHNVKNIITLNNDWVVFDEYIAAEVTVNGSEPTPPACEHEYTYDCDKNCSKCGEETRPEAEHEYFNDCDPICMICGEMTREVSHNVAHVDAVAPGCESDGNVEYWYCETCGAAWLDEACTIITNLMSVKLGATHANVNYVEAVNPACHYTGNTEYWYCADCDTVWADEAQTQITNRLNVVLPAIGGEVEHFDAVEPACHYDGNIEYWVCYECEQVWADEALTQLTNIKNVVLPAIGGEVEHFDAVEPACHYDGNIEYWICYECEQVWADEALTQLTNIKNVVLPAIGGEVVHFDAIEPACHFDGNIEYWVCYECEQVWADEALTQLTNIKNVVLPAIGGEVTHVEAVEATDCLTMGNIEYWYCADCEQVWTDEALTMLSNMMSVKTGYGEHEYMFPCDATCMVCGELTNENAAHSISKVDAVEASCQAPGNVEYWTCEYCGYAWLDEACTLVANRFSIIVPMTEHTYDNAHDADCNVCGDIRDVVLSADEIILFGGNSVTEIKGGLAFRFDAAVDGIVIGEDYVADYTNATVTIGGVEYKLVTMGAIMNNKGYAEQTVENVDGKYVLNIEALKVFGEYSYAVRIINIPEAHLDTVITARPYYVYENEAGEQITVYGADYTATYNGVLNG